MANNEVSKIYAGALLDIGSENNILPRIGEELKFLSELISEDKDLTLFLNAPVISKDKKKELIDRLFKDKFCTDVINFVKVLIDKDRQSLVPEIYVTFTNLVDQINNRQKIRITTTGKLEKNVLERIEQTISVKLNKSVEIEEVIDESILGGIVIRINDMLIDGSVAKDLNLLKAKLIERKVGGATVYED